jgi:hypothetical protein
MNPLIVHLHGRRVGVLADDIVAKSFNLNLNAPAVTEGMVKRIAGFNLHETTLIPSDHAEKLVGFAPAKTDALKRIVKP